MLRFSVYHIYVLAWLLAVAAVALTASILLSTFQQVQAASEETQRETGLAEVITVNSTVAGTMERMAINTDGILRHFLTETKPMTDVDFHPDVILDKITPVLFHTWAPFILSNEEIYANIVTLLYPTPPNGTHANYSYDRSVQVYADLLSDGSRMLTISTTNTTDNLEYARPITYVNDMPIVGDVLYTFNMFTLLPTLNDSYYFAASTWAAVDGNAFWFFIHQRYVNQHGVEGSMQTLASPTTWLDTMLAVKSPGSELLIFDSNNMSLAATPEEELQRLQVCHKNTQTLAPCISQNASTHPTARIRIPFNALFQPQWNSLTAPPVPFAAHRFDMLGMTYTAIAGTLFSRNEVRLNVVWYQVAVTSGDNGGGITAIICTMTIMSTLVLTVLGIFGILLPLMRLGKGLRTVADHLKQGNTEVAIEVRRQTAFTEVDTIGQDFETIVVDFLGFSSANARDTSNAPKDDTKPFTVIFTDIQSSSLLWGRDAVEMARCLQLHHEIIRSLIHRFHMYEVKTVGDSFMITGSSVCDGVQLAVELQEEFFACDWDWPQLEDVYQPERDLLHPAMDIVTKLHSGDVTPRFQHSNTWNGLRVRVGIHYGCGDIVYDEVTKGYDYYGPVVNTSARIEHAGHGGQILASENVIREARPSMDTSRVGYKLIGNHPLRGISNPPPLYEVIPLRIPSRCHPPPRVDMPESITVEDIYRMESPRDTHPSFRAASVVSGVIPSAGDIPNISAEDMAAAHSLVKTGSVPVAQVAQHLRLLQDTVEDLLVPLGPQGQLATTKAICRGWGVALPRSRAEARGALLFVAQRLAETARSVAHLRQRVQPCRLDLRNDSL